MSALSRTVIRVESDEEFEAAIDLFDSMIHVWNGRHWLAWASEDGEWYAIRAYDDDDEPRPDGPDRWRPIGPVSLVDAVSFPWLVLNVESALEGDPLSHGRPS